MTHQCSRNAVPRVRQGSFVSWPWCEYPSASPLETPITRGPGEGAIQHYAIDATAGKHKKQTQRFLYTLARTRVWDPAGALPQRGQVVERPRLAPRRF